MIRNSHIGNDKYGVPSTFQFNTEQIKHLVELNTVLGRRVMIV
jgi:hypothetical protein